MTKGSQELLQTFTNTVDMLFIPIIEAESVAGTIFLM